jgi:hypothetical protein
METDLGSPMAVPMAVPMAEPMAELRAEDLGGCLGMPRGSG